MTRDEQADRVPAERPADRPGRPGRADPTGDVAIARGLAPADGRHLAEDRPVPGRPIGQVDGHGGGRRPRLEEPFERRDGRREPGSSWIAGRGKRGVGHRRGASPDQRRLERLDRGQPRDRDDTPVGDRDVEGTPRAGDGRPEGRALEHRASLPHDCIELYS